MVNKKLIIGLALVAGAAYMLTRKKSDSKITPKAAEDNFTPRVLTDQEALSYLNNNPDLIEAYGAGNIEAAKQHFLNWGFKENRKM